MNKPPKVFYSSSLYAVIKKDGAWAVVLGSNFARVQYSGQKAFCIDWVLENDS